MRKRAPARKSGGFLDGRSNSVVIEISTVASVITPLPSSSITAEASGVI
jgi:hypothetical protein